MAAIKHIESGAVITVAAQPEFIQGIWECGDQRFTDPAGTEYQPLSQKTRAIVGPNEFYFLWTILEQVAIEGLRSTDMAIQLFMRRLDDPRTTQVVLSDFAVQAAIAHTVAALVEKGVVQASEKDARIAAISAGMEPTQ